MPKISEPINTVVDHDRHTRNTIVLNIHGLNHSIDFRSGGDLQNPVSYDQHPYGGIGANGLYDPWKCDGEITVSQSMYHALLEMHRNSAKMGKPRGATHIAYASVDGGVVSKHVFKNVLIAKIPQFSISEIGTGNVTLSISISLNDFVGVE